jgi:protein SCO1
MTENSRQVPRMLWLGFSLLTGLLGLACLLSLLERKSLHHSVLPVIGQIADFTLTNQNGQVTTLADLTNHVWVADIIFTRCAGPCPRLTAQMKGLEILLPDKVRLVTITTDPDNDTPSVLKKYGERFAADSNHWIFLTGTKKEIATLASDSLKLSSVPVKLDEQKNPVDLFIHSTYFVIVDKHAQLRAVFETGGEGVNWVDAVMPKLLATVHQLEREP